MTDVLVDSNVLLDVIGQEETWSDWSSQALADSAESGRLVIDPIIFAEVSVRYSRIEDVEFALPRDAFDREPIPYEAAFLAGKVFAAYRRRGGRKLSPLADFFVGAHAVVSRYALLTRDPRRYRTYFSDLRLIAPR